MVALKWKLAILFPGLMSSCFIDSLVYGRC